MTVTRKAIRKELGRRLALPFFRFYGNTTLNADSGTTTTLVDASHITQADNFWRGDYIYFPATDELREISSSTQSTTTLAWDVPIASGVTTDEYEVWSQFTPSQIHAAINHALRTAWPGFFKTAADETTVVLTSGVGNRYTLPSPLRRLCDVRLHIYNSSTGTTTSAGTATQIIDNNASFTSDDVGKWVAIYKDGGDLLGEIKQVTAIASGTELTTDAFSDTTPSGAKYRLIDKNTTYYNTINLRRFSLDKLENPTELRLSEHLSGFEGFPLELTYEYEYPTLSADADTTSAPEEYIYLIALAYLYHLKMAAAPAAEVNNWEAMFKATRELANQYLEFNRMRHLPSPIIKSSTGGGGYPADYPF